MFISLKDYDLVKSITRTEAKAVHKDLPPGGSWRTIHGHHIYIKDGKILAGSIPGVTKAKKATKAQITEHQATVDREAKKGTKKSGEKGNAKAKDTKPAKPPKTQRAGASTADKGKTAKKASGSAKPTTTTQSTIGLSNVVEVTPKDVAKTLKTWDNSQVKVAHSLKWFDNEDNEKTNKLYAVEKNGKYEGFMEVNALFLDEDEKEMYGYVDTLETNPAHRNGNGKYRGIGSALIGKAIEHSMKIGAKGAICVHPTGDESDAFYTKIGMKKIKDPEGTYLLGFNAKEGKAFLNKLKKGTEENVKPTTKAKGKGVKADDKKVPTKSKTPAKGVQRVAKPKSNDGPKLTVSTANKPSGTKAGAKAPSKKAQDHVELYHGTKLAHLPSIMEHGFEPNGSEDDFGDAVYFKSPSFDHKDHKDWEDWKTEREKAGKQIPSIYKDADRKGNDSKRIVGEFTNKNNPLVIKAVIDKKHVLDCSEGRPKELDNLLKEFDTNTGNKKRVRLAFKHVLGEDTSNMSDDAVMEEYSKRKPDLDKKWGSRFMAGKMSPYEVYAKKHGIGAIVDKLDAYKDEGYQIGVYDNKLIKIVDQGKGLNYNDKGVAELVKALRKAMANGYTLLHHSMTDKGLELHIGAYNDKVKKAFIYIDLSKGAQR